MAKFSWTHRVNEGVQFRGPDSTIEVVVDKILGYDGFRNATITITGVPNVDETDIECNTYHRLTDDISLRILPRRLGKGKAVRMEYVFPDEYDVHEYSVKKQI